MENDTTIENTQNDNADETMTELNEDAPAVGGEESMEASAEESVGEQAPTTAAPESPKTAGDRQKAWESFSAALTAHAVSLGLSMKDQKGFLQFFNATTGHKLYVAKQAKEVGRIDTTLPESVLPEGSTLPLEKPNGKISCHVRPEQDLVSSALDVLASYDQKIRAPERKATAKPATAA